LSLVQSPKTGRTRDFLEDRAILDAGLRALTFASGPLALRGHAELVIK
jgi:hypothetical protein